MTEVKNAFSLGTVSSLKPTSCIIQSPRKSLSTNMQSSKKKNHGMGVYKIKIVGETIPQSEEEVEEHITQVGQLGSQA